MGFVKGFAGKVKHNLNGLDECGWVGDETTICQYLFAIQYIHNMLIQDGDVRPHQLCFIVLLPWSAFRFTSVNFSTTGQVSINPRINTGTPLAK